mmetsp:Transcript_3736/g.7637  ORF Transcript_3736/g.7637 Transcript_3736/m.7637 type:complete len:96 (+) Transcript_3736:1088-1375(+)
MASRHPVIILTFSGSASRAFRYSDNNEEAISPTPGAATDCEASRLLLPTDIADDMDCVCAVAVAADDEKSIIIPVGKVVVDAVVAAVENAENEAW